MSPEAQTAAIAEACGWPMDGSPTHGAPVLNGRCIDPLSDLNAMHEAEKVLIPDRWTQYKNWLWQVFTKSDPWPNCEFYGDDICHATAAKRAEAFLKTIGKWVEE